MHKQHLLAVATLTIAAAFAYQHHQARIRLRAVHADALTERLTTQYAAAAYEARVRGSVDRLMADTRAVDAATEVIDQAWDQLTEGGDDV